MSSCAGFIAAALAVWPAMLVACSREAPPPNASRFAIAIAPLDVAGLTDARYTIAVTNRRGETLWSRQLGSRLFGDGHGGLAYIGACEPGDASAAEDTVALTIDGLYVGDAELRDYLSPTARGPITRAASCVRDGDTPVLFDLVLARPAQRAAGAIDFGGVTCSAALTSAGADVALAFSCVGVAGAPLWLYFDDVVLACRDGAFDATIDPSQASGSASVGGNAAGLVVGATIDRGDRGDRGDRADAADGARWNVALTFDPARAAAAGVCTLHARATATDHALDGGALDADTTYPVITWYVAVVDGGAIVAARHVLDAAGSGVTTGYEAASAPFAHGYRRGDAGAIERDDAAH